jgi:hypothetical protein
MKERDREIDPIFDYLRRSSAVMQLCAFRVRDLVTEEELQPLSPELRQRVEDIVRMHKQPLAIVDDDDDDAKPSWNGRAGKAFSPAPAQSAPATSGSGGHGAQP